MITLARLSRGFTVLLRWAMTVVGLLGAADQLLLHAQNPNPIALMVAGGFVAGAEAMERVAIAFIDRLIAQHAPAIEPKREEGAPPTEKP